MISWAAWDHIYSRLLRSSRIAHPPHAIQHKSKILWRCLLDRLTQISREILEVYRRQLNWWVPGKIARMTETDILQYDRRRDRIDYLRRELEGMTQPQH